MSRGAERSRFLTRTQLGVFREFGVPVRYNRKWRLKHVVGKRCKLCKKPAEQAAHRIPFQKGVLKYRLRPDLLNEPWNLVATCKNCNKKAEWTDARIERYVAKLRALK